MAVKIVLLSAVGVALLAALFTFDIFKEHRHQALSTLSNIQHKVLSALGTEAEPPEVIFTKEELSKYDGGPESKGCCLAVMGKVYDVSEGEKHYGPGGGYSFFSGKDGSRAYVTGEFNEEGLVDDVSDFTPAQMADLEHWFTFYENKYTYIGKVVGNFYDSSGQPTQALLQAQATLELAHQEETDNKLDQKKFPPCNSEWKHDSGGRVWCSNRSGGIERTWVGVPRKYFKAGSTSSRCACIRTEGPPVDDPSSTSNRGDLDNPTMREYDNCKPDSISCPLPNKKS